MKMITKRTKIVCTLGPSTWDKKSISRLFKAGMNVARINTAFIEDLKELKEIADIVRSISSEIALMLDIKGNDVRLNNFSTPIKLKKGDEIVIGSSTGDQIYPANYLDLYKDLKKGDELFFDDGYVKVVVEKISKKKIYCKVREGEVLNPGKSLNTPGIYLSLPPITKKDKEQIDFCVKDGWDFVAASYIRDKKDAQAVMKYLKDTNVHVIAKIEEGMGVSNIEDIIQVVDGIMIARGDMAVEMPYEQIPSIQKMVISLCNIAAKPVINATEVVNSMKNQPRPTRAEITDVANAILDGTDAIMTSGETSVGRYPDEAVRAISRIAVENEKYLESMLIESRIKKQDQIAVAMTEAAFQVIFELDINKVFVITQTGTTARMLSRYDLPVEIDAFVPNDTIKRQLAMTKGVTSYVFPPQHKTEDYSLLKLVEYAINNDLTKSSDKILIFGKVYWTEVDFPNIFEYVEMKKFLKDMKDKLEIKKS
ncbi:pyruvate kinase [Candidatus Dojkabacteria bacterium]|nr:pyruvate kinase [Candidatus Dojkabacteria bacterium]